MSTVNYDFLVKLIMIGDPCVGKSCLLQRFVEGTFTSDYNATVGIDFKCKLIELSGKIDKVHTWHATGLMDLKLSHWLRSAQGALLVYDVTNEESISKLTAKIQEFQGFEDFKMILIGTKTDLIEEKNTPTSFAGQALANEFGIIFFQ
jgi:small GTP-binding protein